MGISASEIESLQKHHDKLKEKRDKTKGSMKIIKSQLQQLGIPSVEDGEKFIEKKGKENERLTSKLEDTLQQIRILLKK